MNDLVYSSYDQEGLDLEYDMRRRCPHFAETFAALEPDNKRVVEKFKCNLDVPFGDSDLQKLDVWPGTGNSPMLMFIHGGYWRKGVAEDFSFIASNLVGAGISVGILNYSLCPSVKLSEIVRFLLFSSNHLIVFFETITSLGQAIQKLMSKSAAASTQL